MRDFTSDQFDRSKRSVLIEVDPAFLIKGVCRFIGAV